MVVGDSPLAILPGLSQDSLNLEPRGSPELSAQRGRLLASRKLEQVLERSRRLPRLPGQRHSLQLPIKTECGVSFCAAGGQGSTEAETKLEAGLEVTEVEGMAPEAWACLPGQGLRYLEHLCLVLEQMARLQQFYLQLQTERSHGVSDSQSRVTMPVSGGKGQDPWNCGCLQNSLKAVSASNVGKLGANPPRLPEVPMEPTHSFSPSQGYKQDLSHWDKVKVLLNRIRWRSSRHSEHPAPPDRSTPTIESRHLSERPPYHPPQKTFIPSLVVKKPLGASCDPEWRGFVMKSSSPFALLLLLHTARKSY
uniref:DUF4657 domain-containing protein n=1 Tax=Castor canadensis TaxID=51338 RepID=A0A8C0XJB9_CASCN